jgi:T-complex protein 1 subunit zeta
MVCFISFIFNSNDASFFLIGCVIPGGGAFEIVAYQALTQYKEQVKGRARLGVQAFAESLLIIPKAIAQNAGHDQQETIVKLQHEYATSKIPVGIDIATGKYFFK